MATDQRDVAVLVGSLRKGSYSRAMANAVIGVAPERLRLEIVEIRDLALYDQDLEENVPAPWGAFRDRVRRADAVLFVTPEYNRSIPGALKNALDVGSRPYGKSVFKTKPAGIISNSPGAIGAFGANHHLRQCLVFLDMPAMTQPEAYLGGVNKLFDAEGKLTNDGTRDFLKTFMESFARWIDRHPPAAR
jgi:chromate reductase